MNATSQRQTGSVNHNEALVRQAQASGLKVRTGIKSGGLSAQNHNEAQASGLKVHTGVKAGGTSYQHSEAFVRRKQEEIDLEHLPLRGR